MLEVMPTIHTAKEYDNLMDKFGAESNGIENLTYHMFKDYPNNHIEPKNYLNQMLKNILNLKIIQWLNIILYYLQMLIIIFVLG